MTIPQHRIRNFSAIGMALAWTSLTFGAAITPTPAEARSNGPFYTVELAAPAAEARTIISGQVWQCDGAVCLAGKGTSRPLNICKRVVREMGAVTRFSADDKDLSAEDIASCNGN